MYWRFAGVFFVCSWFFGFSFTRKGARARALCGPGNYSHWSSAMQERFLESVPDLQFAIWRAQRPAPKSGATPLTATGVRGSLRRS